MGGVTGDAPALDDGLRGLKGDGRRVAEAARGRGGAGDPHRQRHDRDQRRHTPQHHPAVAAAPEVHHVLHRGAQDHEQHQHQPVERVAVGAGEVVAEHGEEHRKRQVVVVQGAHLGAGTQGGVHRLAGLGGREHLGLGRNDSAPDVGDHDGAEHGAEVDEGAAAAQEMREGERRRNHQREGDPRRQRGPTGERGAPQRIVEKPRAREQREAEGDRPTQAEARSAIDQEDAAA